MSPKHATKIVVDDENRIAGRVWAPHAATGAEEMIYAPGDEVAPDVLAKLEDDDSVRFEPVAPNPANVPGHRDTIAAEALDRLENTSDPEEARIQSEVLRNRGERALAGRSSVASPFDRAYAENARRIDNAMAETGVRTAAQLENPGDVDELLPPGTPVNPATGLTAEQEAEKADQAKRDAAKERKRSQGGRPSTTKKPAPATTKPASPAR